MLITHDSRIFFVVILAIIISARTGAVSVQTLVPKSYDDDADACFEKSGESSPTLMV